MKEETKTGLITGLGVGVILSLIINLFLIYGGNPRGMFWRVDDNKKAIEFNEENNRDIISQIGTLAQQEAFNDVQELNKLFLNHRHSGIYGKIK